MTLWRSLRKNGRVRGFIWLIGFDSCCYTNRDIEKREIRFDMDYFMDHREGRF